MSKNQETEEHVDRRPERTRQWLQKALIELILQHNFEDISVQMIVDQANVARITFYRHYRDKNELLIDYLDKVRDDLNPYLSPVAPETMAMSGNVLPMMPLFQYIAQQRALYKALLCGSVAAAVRRQMQASMVAYTSQNLTRMLPQLDQLTQTMIAHCITGTTLGMLIWWLDNDEPCPIEELAQTVFRHNTMGLAGFMAGGPR